MVKIAPQEGHTTVLQSGEQTVPAQLAKRRAAGVLVLACLAACCAVWVLLGVGSRPSPESWTPPSAESLRADEFLASRFTTGEPHLALVATSSGSVDDPRVTRAGQKLLEGLAADPRTEWVRGYWPLRLPEFRTADGRRALVLVRFRGDERAVRTAANHVMTRYTGKTGPGEVLKVSAGGEDAVLSESERLSERGLLLAEFIAAPAILLILLWVFASAVAALLPVVVGAFAVVVAGACLRLLDGVVPVSAFSVSVTTALGFGLAVDYSLLLVSRYREEVAAGNTPDAAVEVTLRTAGRAVAFSGATVVAALCTLLVVPLPLLRSLAFGGTAIVVTSVVGALAVVPALLVVLGARIDRGDVFARLRRPRGGRRESDSWARLARWVVRRPAAVALAGFAFLVLLAVPALQVRFGVYADATLPGSSPVAATARTLRTEFGSAASGAPSVVLPGLNAEADSRERAALDGYARRLSRVSGVALVDTVTGVYQDGNRSPLPAARAASFAAASASRLSVTPQAYARAPLTPEGSRLVERLRRVPAPVPALVGGPGARLADTEKVMTDRLPLVAVLACGGTFLLLLLYTRSLLVPVKAVLLNMLSLAATFGVLVAVFQEGWFPGVSPAGITDVLIPLMFAVAFGLSMDYEVFLLSRILEEHRRGSPTPLAVATGLQQTGRLFTSAALVFAVSMSSLALSGLLHLRVVGVGLAVAVLVDCTVVRALLVPAVMQLAGRVNWWLPTWRGSLQRGAVPKTWSQ
ncbi:MMPL family transporter [Streptomyces europaeiscabiei]|uniref:MMPL family transporter n=1 Tax=Streptomyces europaeiscabiei TaxID=146819 RepID=UPI0029AC3A3F|nr:MMPL family transporter [Streptomyces europaeiscabiei]MDX2528120.1 MMPL family transporter [Streptomyces europaeiscabiei]MDX2757722.1 MMPL family transporter [Streptomyces europaeiscabiei]MDX2767718.1 MMPL family transporter [Streptomyces europaeiscabiei]MDX3666878.1 MMPL family transporter [Streptomyces europaeiscabiei]MDX3781195.1 MMPL family transporter [Streptomyces europaeiscabiei]